MSELAKCIAEEAKPLLSTLKKRITLVCLSGSKTFEFKIAKK